MSNFTANDAAMLYENQGKELEKELEKMLEAIKKVAKHSKNLHLTTGLNQEAQREQDKIWPNFEPPISDYTIAELKKRNFIVKTHDSKHDYDYYIDVSWAHIID